MERPALPGAVEPTPGPGAAVSGAAVLPLALFPHPVVLASALSVPSESPRHTLEAPPPSPVSPCPRPSVTSAPSELGPLQAELLVKTAPFSNSRVFS